jgi:class 3 adenylate cyclase
MNAARVCPACGSLEAHDASFCSRCGQKLLAGGRRERRALVSIVFCDLAGSTALGERLDAEVLRGVQERYFAAAAGALRAHGGQVEKYIGDAVMCVFGLPAAREDDALRAVRGALDLAAGIEQLNVALRAELGVELAVRIGINTGEVVAGDHSTGQALVTGDTVNTAARLEHAAPAGGILMGSVTQRLVAGRIDAEAVEPITAEGKSKPVSAWHVRGLSVGASVRVEDAPRLVGRAQELRRLRESLDRVTQEHRAELVIVSGEAGIGKSRLVAELLSGLREGRAYVGACPSYGRGNTYRPVRELIDALAPSSTVESVARLLAGQAEASAIARRLLRLTGYEAGAVTCGEAFGAVARLLASLAVSEPLVVVFEDLHWAEPTFLELLDFLTETLQARVLLVGTAREELFEERPGLADQALHLDPLSPEAAAQLVVQRHALSTEEARRVVARADGNPLFLEQLGASFEDGAEDLPPDIASLIAARLDRLETPARDALEAAAIVGREFWPGALTALLDGDEVIASLGRSLERLETKELIARGRSEALAAPTGLSGVFAGDRLHIRHALVHDGVLSAMPKARRANLHERFAASLRAHADHEPAVVAYHLEEAARLRMELRPRDAPPAVAARAAEQLEEAGRQALERDDAAAASLLLNRAKTLLPEVRK